MLSGLSPFQTFLFLFSLVAALLVCLFGLNTYILLYLGRIRRRNVPETSRFVEEWPFVTVQIATYNEKNVIQKTLENCLSLDYPMDKLEVVVVDDSTDETVEMLKEIEAKYYPRVKVIHRLEREGYKAGALNIALRHSKGEFFLILDADTLPNEDFLKETIPFFLEDEKLGFAQGKIEYVNAKASWLTKSLALANDWYVSFSQPALSKGRMFLSFIGHGGLFRKTAIEDAGGWRSDTITEDMDLSYRIQMKGWKAIFDETAKSKEEIPTSFHAAVNRYNRHIKGPIQNLWKHGYTLMKKRGLSNLKKFEALIQMAYPLSYLLGLICVSFSVLTYLFVPAIFLDGFWFSPLGILFSLFMLATFPYLALIVSFSLSSLLIAVLSLFVGLFALKKKERNGGSLDLISLFGASLIWNDNMLTGAKAMIELLVGKEATWVPTPRIEDGTKSSDGATAKMEKNRSREALVRISASILMLSIFVTTLLKNFTFNAFGMLLPASFWLISTYLLLKKSSI